MGARCAIQFILFLVLGFSFKEAQAQAWLDGYTNVRSLGMGGAEIGLTSDETSLYRNPANLGSIRGTFGTVLDPELAGSSNFLNLITSSNTAKSTDIEALGPIMAANPNTTYHSRLQLTPSLIVRNFGFGLIYRNELNAISDSTGATMNTQYQSDMGGIIGLNQSFFGGVLKVGASAKGINRIEVINTSLATSGTLSLQSIGSEGTGVVFDAGVMIQMPVKWIPTISVVGHDLGDTEFYRKSGVRLSTASQPTIVKQSIDAAVSIFPIHSSQVRSIWTVEYKDITNSKVETDYSRRLHVGTELNVYDIVFLRLGMNQNYLTYGLELASEKMSWQFASYGEEVGTSTTKQEDRRYVFKVSLRL